MLAATIAGCDLLEENSIDAPTSNSCAGLIDRAADAVEIEDQIDLLDTALVVCRSVAAFDQQLARYPGVIGYDAATFITSRCDTARVEETESLQVADDLDAVASSTICAEVAVPTTTTTVPAPPEVTYLGQTLDGRQVVIRPSGLTPFVDGKPTPVVQIVDIASEDGCAGVQAEFDRWNAQVEDASIGEEASVYAQHAKNVLKLYGCELPPD
jgi:hypothetical protein